MRWIAVLALAGVGLLGGCFESKLRYCDNGGICPETLTCTEHEPTVCAEEADVSACKTVAEGRGCASSLTPVGTCASGACTVCSADDIDCRYAEWKVMTPATDKKLNAVWVGAADNVYAAGDGVVLHYDGTHWATFATPSSDSFVGIWGSGDELFVVADNGNAFHYAGTWTPITAVTNPTTSVAYRLFGVWGSDASNVFATGEAGGIFQLAGSAWQQMTSNTSVPMRAINGTTAVDVYVVGNTGVVQHYNGSNWQASPNTPLTGLTLYGVWAHTTGKVVAVGYQGTNAVIVAKEAAGWNRQTAPTTLLASVWGSADDAVYAVGAAGTITRFDGSQWTTMPSGTTADLLAVGGTADNVFAVGANGTVVRYAQ